MKKIIGVSVLAAVAAFGVTSATAQEVASPKSRMRLVRAFCTTGPCAPDIDFESGSAHINRLKQPKPLAKRKIGRIRLLGVQSTPLPSAVDALLTARFVYDTVDPDSDCPDLGSDTVGTLATSSMFCRQQIDRASCGGDLLVPLGLFDPRCTDVRVTFLDLKVEVFEFGQVGVEEARIATDGISILGRSPDCSSGGSGCP